LFISFDFILSIHINNFGALDFFNEFSSVPGKNRDQISSKNFSKRKIFPLSNLIWRTSSSEKSSGSLEVLIQKTQNL